MTLIQHPDPLDPERQQDRGQSSIGPARAARRLLRTARAAPLAAARDVMLVVLAVLAVWANLDAFRGYVFEDAYITYRYADNLARGEGFVFTAGEHVLGTSTPFYTLLLALCRLVGLDIVGASERIFAVSLSLVALGGAWVLRRCGSPNLGAVYAIMVLWGTGDVLHFWGMETAFYTLLLLITVICAWGRRPVLTGVALGCAFLTRYDAFMLVAALAVVAYVSERRLPWRTYLTAGAIVAPWLVFAQVYFGSVLPNTLAAKLHEVAPADYLYSSAAWLIYGFLKPLLRFGPESAPPKIVTTLFLLALVAPLYSQTAAVLRRRGGALILLLVVPILQWLGYAAIGPPLAHRWYLVPGLHLFVLFCFLAWGAAIEGWDRNHAARWGQRLPTLAALVLLVVAALYLPAGARNEARHKTSSERYEKRVEAYRLLARWINDHELGDLKLLTREPGFLTYHTRNPVIDGAGLVTPGIYVHGTKVRRTPWEEILATYEPEMIVGSSELEESGLTEGYQRVYAANQVKALWIREQTFKKRLRTMTRGWLGEDYFPGEIDPPGHPLSVDFEGADSLRWLASRPGWDPVGNPKELRLGKRVVEGKYLHTFGINIPLRVVSEPFRIDFDVLSFDFSAHRPDKTRVELVVNGLVVLSREGRGELRDKMQRVDWPVQSWRGKIGTLRLVDTATRDGFVAIDRVRSARFVGRELFDDFETGTFAPQRWAQSFAPEPCRYPTIARRHGLQTILGRFTAATICVRGRDERQLVSQPFEARHRRLAFTVLDFADGGWIELRAGERVVHRFRGSGSGHPRGVIWELETVEGQSLVLAAGGRAAIHGIGIDDIVLYDDLEEDGLGN